MKTCYSQWIQTWLTFSSNNERWSSSNNNTSVTLPLLKGIAHPQVQVSSSQSWQHLRICWVRFTLADESCINGPSGLCRLQKSKSFGFAWAKFLGHGNSLPLTPRSERALKRFLLYRFPMGKQTALRAQRLEGCCIHIRGVGGSFRTRSSFD